MSTTVLVRDVAPRDWTADLFVDITTAPYVVAWQPPTLAVTFDADLTPTQVLSVQVRARALDVNEETILRAAWQALQSNRNYLQTPRTTAGAIAQVDELTRQINGIIRRVIGIYDGTD